MSLRWLPVLFFAALPVAEAQAAPSLAVIPISSSQKAVEDLGTGIAIALPLTAAAITLYKHDRKGLAELAVESFFTVGTAYALKNIVRERRPDNSDFQSFPSDTTALAGSGAAYLWGRYGWSYGLPAFAATEFVAYSRVQAKQHHWYDTLASSAIAAGYGYAFTTPLKKKYNINTTLNASPDGAQFQISYAF